MPAPAALCGLHVIWLGIGPLARWRFRPLELSTAGAFDRWGFRPLELSAGLGFPLFSAGAFYN